MEPVMPYSQSCSYLFAEGLHGVQSFLKSDAAHLMLATITMGRFVVQYLRHCKLPEANELAAAAIVAMILAVLMAIGQSDAPRKLLSGIQCNSLQAGDGARRIELPRVQRGRPS
jgi:hypothetical protein